MSSNIEMMEVKRKRPKGGFFNLFDWNRKSKKLSAHHAGSPGVSQGISTSHLQRVIEMGPNSSPSALSIYSEEGICSRPPSVVAKLMGLDSIPVFNTVDPSSSRSYSLRSPGSSRFYWNYPPIGSPCSALVYDPVRSMADGYVWNSVELRHKEIPTELTERFQNEVLPLQPAKSISITHQNIVSPNKSPGYTMRRNSAYITEVVTKIAKDYPRETQCRVPSIPNRIRELKRTIGPPHKSAGQTVVSSTSAKKKASIAKWNGSETVRSNGTSLSPVKNSADVERRNRISPTSRVKASEQTQEGSPTRRVNDLKSVKHGNTSYMACRRSPPHKVLVANGTSKNGSSSVLKQNDLKQNGLVAKIDSNLSKVKSNQQVRKSQLPNASVVPGRDTKTITHKPGDRTRKAPVGSGERKGNSISSEKNSVNRYLNNEKNSSGIVSINNATMNFERCDPSDGSKDLLQPSIKTSMDVVSFTFSSPIKSKSSAKLSANKYRCSESQISAHESVIEPDAISSFLEQKLQELTESVQFSSTNFINLSSCESTVVHRQRLPNLHSMCSETSSQISSDNTESMKLYGISRDRSESCEILEYQDSGPVFITETLSDVGKIPYNRGDENFSASVSAWSLVRSHKADSFSVRSENSNGIINYLRCMFRNAHAMLDEFVTGRTSRLVEPFVFDFLDNLDHKPATNGTEFREVERKLLFDCASEWIDLTCGQVSFGEPRALARLWALFQSEELAADKVYSEILHWKSMETLMLDEVIDKDMSSQYGKWIDFNEEALEEGVSFEAVILSSLLDEFVSELLPSQDTFSSYFPNDELHLTWKLF